MNDAIVLLVHLMGRLSTLLGTGGTKAVLAVRHLPAHACSLENL